MKRLWIGLGVAAAMFAAAPRANAATSVGVHIQIGDPYRGASIDFHNEPDVVIVPATKVYYVRGYHSDVYRYGRYWYFVEQDHWYRARSWRGPFVHVHAWSVPRTVRTVPVQYRRNWHGPPRHAVARGYYKNKNAPDRHFDNRGPNHKNVREREQVSKRDDKRNNKPNAKRTNEHDDRQAQREDRGRKH